MLLLLVVIFLMGLSLLGVFTLPVIDLKASTSPKNPFLQSYITGIMTTFLATPCSGPLLGGVLGWTFSQPLPILTFVFWSIGIGMSLPYILFSLFPKTVHILPKSGKWIYVLEHVAGFFLLGTSLYLLSIFPTEKYIHILSVLLITSISAWLWGQYCDQDAPKIRKHVVGTIGFLMLLFACHWALQPISEKIIWEEFSAENFTSQLGKKLMLVEFTADWCPNCKVMEKTVLTDSTLNELQQTAPVTLIRADLTSPDAAATYLLTQLGSHSIPLTAIFPKGAQATSPIVLRDIYSTKLLKKNFALAAQAH
ncbi:MAG: thioredoxin family protein [Desulfovibrio sp.]|nr:thioredoxin family protein [Desulfovibrio sp.]